MPQIDAHKVEIRVRWSTLFDHEQNRHYSGSCSTPFIVSYFLQSNPHRHATHRFRRSLVHSRCGRIRSEHSLDLSEQICAFAQGNIPTLLHHPLLPSHTLNSLQLNQVACFSQVPIRFQEVAKQAKSEEKTVATKIESPVEEKAVQRKEKEPSKLVKLYQQAKKLITFYKDGIKLLWANHQTAKALKDKVSKEGHVLTRDEFQLVRLSAATFYLLPHSNYMSIDTLVRERHGQTDSFCCHLLHPCRIRE